MVPFLAVDTVFLGANLLKIAEGGWLPLVVGAAIMAIMLTWRRGARLLDDRARNEELSLAEHLSLLERKFSERVPGTGVFMTSHSEAVPTALLHNLKHNKVMHKRNVIVTIETADTPRVEEAERGRAKQFSTCFTLVQLRFGYMEEPDVPRALARRRLGLDLDPQSTSYYLSRRVLRPAARSPMPQWQQYFFLWLARRSSDASQYFNIPTDRVIEVGTQIVV